MKLGAPEKGPGWKEKLAEKRAAEGAAARAEGAAYGGREVFGDVPAASDEELVALSKLMNERLQDPAVFPDPAARDWCAHLFCPWLVWLCRLAVVHMSLSRLTLRTTGSSSSLTWMTTDRAR